MARNFSILIIDDHMLFRDSFATVLRTKNSFMVAGVAGDPDTAIEIADRKKPGIIMLDLNLDNVYGLDLVPALLTVSPLSAIILLSMHPSQDVLKKGFRAGARGYVTKNDSYEVVVNAIKKVAEGGRYISKEILNREFGRSIFLPGDPGTHLLTRKEREVLRAVREGATSKEIAANMNVAVSTVQAHRYNILKKFKVKNTAALLDFTFKEVQL